MSGDDAGRCHGSSFLDITKWDKYIQSGFWPSSGQVERRDPLDGRLGIMRKSGAEESLGLTSLNLVVQDASSKKKDVCGTNYY
ncbi:MAG TPA: hypothetical protein VLX91_01465 [Candidatus Acidoferrales bacterium]|nr:hypothetical protein [Candidatus Acidoferrales bacterium]